MRTAGFLLLLGALACAGGNRRAAGDTATQTAVVPAPAQDTAPGEAPGPLRLTRLEERAPSPFPHAPHLGFDCRRCHTQVAGHERHANVACRQCHEAPAPTAAGASAPDCNGCHHSRARQLACAHCHDRDQRLLAPRSLRLTMRLAGTPAERTVSFPHARHGTLECTRCHLRPDGAPAAAQCASCHERQHRADAQCAACHSVPRAGVHAAESHRGCGGAGCHQNPAVLALPLAPAVCLACHPAQAQHEPGGDCAGCHNLRAPVVPAGKAGAP